MNQTGDMMMVIRTGDMTHTGIMTITIKGCAEITGIINRAMIVIEANMIKIGMVARVEIETVVGD